MYPIGSLILTIPLLGELIVTKAVCGFFIVRVVILGLFIGMEIIVEDFIGNITGRGFGIASITLTILSKLNPIIGLAIKGILNWRLTCNRFGLRLLRGWLVKWTQ